jgi:hypothetical protein
MHLDPIATPVPVDRPAPGAWASALHPAAPFDPWQTFHAACDVWSGGHADAAGLARRRAWRLRDLLESACAAPLHAERLRSAGGASIGDPGRSVKAAQRAARLPLDAIAPIGRDETMERFDEACTDRTVTLERVQAFIADPARIGDAFLGRYAVWTSSGTTGSPGIWVHDARALAVYDALETLRFGGFDRPGRGAGWFENWLRAPTGSGGRYAMLGATGGHFAGVASVERLRRLWPLGAASMRCVSILQPLRAQCAELDAFAPSVIATYPTAAALLADEHRAGRLHVRPQEIWLGGEQLTEAVRRRPYQVILFDEVEKAHPDVFNVLLQVLDDGRLTDGQGRTVDFKQTLIVLTSNLGAYALSQLPDGADPGPARREVMEAVRAHFKPEFLNRLDDQIIFDRLGRDDMAGIVAIQLQQLEKRLAGRKITLDIDPAAKAWLAGEGYDPVYGARPLKRVIQRSLQDPLAEMILSGDVLDGETVTVSAGADGLIIGDRVAPTRRERPMDAVVH